MAWLSGWSYRKEIPIPAVSISAWAATTAYSLGAIVKPSAANDCYYTCTVAGTSHSSEPTWPTTDGQTVSDGTVTWICNDHYQARLDVYKGSGTDSTGIVYLGDKCTSFPNDIRFTDNGGTAERAHWFETNVGSDTTYRRFWVKLKGAIYTAQTIYIYYGKSGQATASNATNTFIKYKGSASATFCETVASLGTQLRYKGRVKNTTTGDHNLLWGIANKSAGADDGLIVQSYKKTSSAADNRYFKTVKTGSISEQITTPAFTKDQWYIVEALYKATAAGGYVDGSQIGSDITTNLPTADMGLWMWVVGGTGEQDWSFVAKFVSPEPAVGTAGSEQETHEASAFFMVM